jgi:integrase
MLTRRIQDVSVSDAAAVLYRNRHLAEWTRVHIYRLLAGTFAHAFRRGLLSRNPMDGLSKAERPKQRNKRNVARLAAADVGRLIHAATTKRDKAAIGLAAYAGLRIGEIRALHWNEVDFKAGTVTVLRSCMEDGTFKQPKSESGIRTVPMLPALRELLIPLARFGGLVIATADGKPVQERNLRRSLETAKQRAGLDGTEARLSFSLAAPLLRLHAGNGARAPGDHRRPHHGTRGRRLHAQGVRARRA